MSSAEHVRHAAPAAGAAGKARGVQRCAAIALVPTVMLLLGALYCLLPVAWVVIASTKTNAQLFNTFTFAPGTGFAVTTSRDLNAYRDGIFWHWMLNTALYAGRRRAAVDRACPALTGYALAKYRFRGRATAVQHPARRACWCRRSCWPMPQYLLLAKVGLTDTLLVGAAAADRSRPYGIYLARIYAAAAVPGRGDRGGAGWTAPSEWRIFARIAVPMMVPGTGDGVPVPVRRGVEQLPAAVHHAQRRRTSSRSPSACTRCSNQGANHARAVHAGGHRRAAVDHPADRAVPGRAAVLATGPALRSGQVMTSEQVSRGTTGRQAAAPSTTWRAEAGVSRGTVSRVLNGGHYVSAAAPGGGQRGHPQDRLRRQPARPRRWSPQRPSRSAFILSEPQERLFEDPNFNVLLRGCTQALAEHDIALLLMLAGDRGRAAAHHAVPHRRPRRRRAAGLQSLRRPAR